MKKPYFNSSIVRLKASNEAHSEQLQQISIQVLCD